MFSDMRKRFSLGIATSNNQNMSYESRVGFGPRLGARLIDAVILIIIITVASLVGIGGGLASASTGGEAGIYAALAAAAAAVFFIIAYSLIEAFTGASPGKMMLGLKVANEDGTEGTIGLYLARWAVYNAGALLGVIPVIGLLGPFVNLVIFGGCFAVLGEKRQGLHDMICKTAVFKKSDIK